jgi:hypothetical protein
LGSLRNFQDNSSYAGEWLSKLTAKNGGSINAPVLTTLNAVEVTLNNTGSLQVGSWINWTNGIGNFSSNNYVMPALVNASGTALNVTSGSLDISNVTTMVGGSLILSGGATVNASNLTSIQNGQISLSGGAIVQVPKLGNIDAASILITGGVELSLPLIRSYASTTRVYFGESVEIRTSRLRASGTGSVLSLPNLTSIDNGSQNVVTLDIIAEVGGRINLPSVNQISDTADATARRVWVTADGVGSTIDMGSLRNFQDNSSQQGEWISKLTAKNGAKITLSDETSFRAVSIDFDSRSFLVANTIVLQPTSTLTGNGKLWGSLTNQGSVEIPVGSTLAIQGNYTQGGNGELVVSINGDLASSAFSQMVVDGEVSLSGTLSMKRLQTFLPDLETDFPIISGESVVGTFGRITGNTISGGDFLPVYGSSTVVFSRNFDRVPFSQFVYVNTQPNQRSYFDVKQVEGGRVTFRLYDPNQKLVGISNAFPANPNSGDFGTFRLKEVGNYEVRAYRPIGVTTVFDAKLNEAKLDRYQGSFRPLIESEIRLPGQKKVWEFVARIGDAISLDVVNVIGLNQNIDFQLRDPSGTVIANRTVTDQNFNDADFGPFAALKNGTYTLTVDGIGDDTASFQFVMSGPQAPKIRTHSLRSTIAGQVNEAWFQFDQAMDQQSFSLNQDLLFFQNASGNINPSGFRWQDSSTLVITFSPLALDSVLFMALAPSVVNVAGVPLDQDDDRVPGESVEDQYFASLTLDTQGPYVIHVEPGSTGSAPLDRISLHFNEPIDSKSFTLSDVTAFSGPGAEDLRARLQNVLVGERSVTVFFDQQITSGSYSITIGPNITDASGNLMDQSRDRVAGQANDAFTQAFQLQAADLQVVSVTNPLNALNGDRITLSWEVKNDGTDPAAGIWWDYVYLSADTQWDLGDAIAARVLYDTGSRGVLNPGATYTQSVTVEVPGLLPGNYRVLVRSNILRNLAEADLDDNTGVSVNTAFYDFPVLVDEVTRTRPVDYRAQLYYRIDITEAQLGASALVRFGTLDTSVANELYVSRGSLPTRAKHDLRSNQGLTSNQWIVLSNVEPGTYYVLATASPDVAKVGPLGNAFVGVDVFEANKFGVANTVFGKGGTAGRRTIEINGVNFDRSINVSLSLGTGNPIDAVSYYRAGSDRLYATFDLSAVIPGIYSVSLKSRSNQTVTIPNSLEVVSGGGSTNKPTATTVDAFRRATVEPLIHFPLAVTWANTGLNDAISPFVIVSANEPFGRDINEAIEGAGQYESIILTSDSARSMPGALLPGQQGAAAFQVVPRLQRDVTVGRETLTYEVDRLFKREDVSFDWNLLLKGLPETQTAYPMDIDVLRQLQTQVGESQADFGRMLSRNLKLWPGTTGEQLTVRGILSELIAIEAESAKASVRTSIRGSVIADDFAVRFAGATVLLSDIANNRVFETKVLNDGSFLFGELPAGTYSLSFDGGVIPSTTVIVAQNEHKVINLSAEPGGEIAGVIKSSNGSPISDASVHLVGTDRITSTDNFGAYSFSRVPVGDYAIEASVAGFGGKYASVGFLGLNSKFAKDLDLAIEGIVQGQLLTKNTSTPLSNVRGRLTPVNHSGLPATFVTDVSGRLIVPNLASGRYQLVIDASNLLMEPVIVDVSSGTTTNVNLRAEQSASVIGKVQINGLVFADSVRVELVTVNGAIAKTSQLDSSQQFSITGISPGNYSVLVRVEGAIAISKAVTVAVGSTTDLGTIAPARVSRVNGTVGGGGVNTIIVETTTGESVLTTTTNSDGTFIFGVLADGSYRVRAISQDAIFSSVDFAVVGGVSDKSSLSLIKGNRRISGSVQTQTGSASSSGRVYARRLAAGVITAETVSAETNASGDFSLENLTAGEYRIFAFADGSGFVSQLVTVATTDLIIGALRLGVPNNLSGTVTGPNSEVISGAVVTLYHSITGAIAGYTKSSESGSYEVKDLAEGQYSITASADGMQTFTGNVNVSNSPTTQSISFSATQTSIMGNILEGNGRPIGGGLIYAVDSDGRMLESGLSDETGTFSLQGIPRMVVTIVAEVSGAAAIRRSVDLTQLSTADVQITSTLHIVNLTTPALIGSGEAPSGSGSVWENYWLDDSDLDKLKDPSIKLPEMPDCLSEEARRLYEKARQSIKVMDLALESVKGNQDNLEHAVNEAVANFGIQIFNIAVDIIQMLPQVRSFRTLLALSSNRQFGSLLINSIASVTDAVSVADGVSTAFSEPKKLLDDVPGTIDALNSARTLVSEAIEVGTLVVRQSGSILDVARRNLSLLQWEKFAESLGKLSDVIGLLTDISSAFSSLLAGLESVENTNQQFNSSVQYHNLWKLKARKALADFEAAKEQQKVRADAIDDMEVICEDDIATGNVLANDIPIDCIEGTIYVATSLSNRIAKNGSYNFGGLAPGTHTFSYTIAYKDKTGREIFLDNATLVVVVNEKMDCPPPPDPCADPEGYKRWKEQCKCSEADQRSSSSECGSRDPNDIVGPAGVGTGRYIPAEQKLNYTINFENDPEQATAPAAVVRIVQTMDSDLDFSSFRLGIMGFGDVLITEAVGQTSFRSRLYLTQKFKILVDIRAGIDVSKGEAFWEFKSIDPKTGEIPFSPFLGFLPPNKLGSEGQGFVAYSISARSSIQTDDVIDATASIIFDQNDAIETPPIFNTIDATAPTCRVATLPAQTYPGLTVSWPGTDAGSGIAEYDVYYSQNGGPITPWLIGTELTSANFFQAVPGSSYAFFSVATDAVGYREEISEMPDASTTILPSASIVGVVTSRNSVVVSFTEPVPIQSLIDNNSIAGHFTIRDIQEAAISLTNPSFAYDAALRTLNVTWSNSLAQGDYSFSFNTSGFTDAAGSKLSPGLSGVAIKVRDNAVGSPVKANGTDIVSFEAQPSMIDLDGDGKNDLIVGERTATGQSKVRFYRNSGTASNPIFDNPLYLQGVDGDLVISDEKSQFRFHDWNGDGELDLTVGRSDGRIEIWSNINTTADAVFGVPRFVTTIAGSVATQIDVGNQATPEWVDWNNDGRKDLIVSSEDGYLSLFIDQATRGAPRFAASSYIMLGNARIKTPNPGRVSTGDLNGDGRFDIVVGTGGMLIFYPNVGTLGSPRFVGGWQMGLTGLPDNARELSPDLADLNGDGQSDVVVGTAAGSISFHPMQVSTTPLSNRSLVSAEVNDRVTHIFSVEPENSKKWQNPLNPLDVNGDGIVAPLDVLAIINHINEQPGPPPVSFQSPFLDVDGDDLITPLDALRVINFINSNSGVQGEAEIGLPPSTVDTAIASKLSSTDIGLVDAVFMNDLDNWVGPSCGCAIKSRKGRLR